MYLFGSETEGSAPAGFPPALGLWVPVSPELLQQDTVALLCPAVSSRSQHCPAPVLQAMLSALPAGDSWVGAAGTGLGDDPASASAHMGSTHGSSAPLTLLLLFQRSSWSGGSLANSPGSQCSPCPCSASHPPLLPRLSSLPAH